MKCLSDESFTFFEHILAALNEGRIIVHKSIDLFFSALSRFFINQTHIYFQFLCLFYLEAKNTWTSENISAMICEIILMKKKWSVFDGGDKLKVKTDIWACFNDRHTKKNCNHNCFLKCTVALIEAMKHGLWKGFKSVDLNEVFLVNIWIKNI